MQIRSMRLFPVRHAAVSAGILAALAILIGLAVGGSTLAQEGDRSSESSDSPIDASGIAVLELGTYEPGWIRYLNVDSDGAVKLAAGDSVTFPFARINNGAARMRIDDLERPGFVAELIARHGIAWDDENVDGQCDPNFLRGYNSTDLYCRPGTEGMAHGQIFLVLYDPATREPAAITTTIDNVGGGALLPAAPPAAAPAAQGESAQGCGPYVPGQWIRADNNDVAGLGIPVIPVPGEGQTATDYQCIVPEGGSPYFQAYHISGKAGGAGRTGAQAAGARDNSRTITRKVPEDCHRSWNVDRCGPPPCGLWLLLDRRECD